MSMLTLDGCPCELVVTQGAITIVQRQFWTPGRYHVRADGISPGRGFGRKSPLPILDQQCRCLETHLWARSVHPEVYAVVVVPNDVVVRGSDISERTTIMTERSFEAWWRSREPDDGTLMSLLDDLLTPRDEMSEVPVTEYDLAGV